jgi:oligopeptidase A
VWKPGVEFYRIERTPRGPQGHALVGQFYLDQPARTGKRGGAWMDDVRARWLRPDNGKLQTPVAHLVCNFADGVGGKPALLTHDDVTTLFHEFGHGLHHMLTQVNERDVSGISGVEWDAVELPSQFMENFCWEWDVLKHMTAHVDTGAPLPRALFDKMLAAKNFQSGMQTLAPGRVLAVRHAAAHLAQPGRRPDGPAERGAQGSRGDPVAGLQPHRAYIQSHFFRRVCRGYYSYKWAEVLSADAYAAF